MVVVKNIFRYLKRTLSPGIWYPVNLCFFVQAFSDADLGGCGLDRKSMAAGCQFLDGKLVSKQSKKETCVPLSTTEVEYITAASCAYLLQEMNDIETLKIKVADATLEDKVLN
ncbi:hypothetical protein Lser_V15G13034 [Lactuca serriola]